MFSIILTFHYFFMNKFKKNSTYSFVTLYNSSLLLLINWMHPWLIKALLIPNVWTILYITAFTVNECLHFCSNLLHSFKFRNWTLHSHGTMTTFLTLPLIAPQAWETMRGVTRSPPTDSRPHTVFLLLFLVFFFWLPSTLPRAHRPQPGPFHIFE